MIGIASRCEGIRGILSHQIDFRERQIAPHREVAYQCMQARSGCFGDLLCAVHAQNNLVGKPIGSEVHCAGNGERDEQTGPSSQGLPHPEQKCGQRR